MTEPNIPTGPLLKSLIMASAGTPRNFRVSFWGQLLLGFLYSFGYFNLRIVGLIIGFVVPVIWVICTYRLLKARAKQFSNLSFPRWMQKDPGNGLVIIFDIFFLGLIWFFILSGLYEAIWLKVLFTIAFPLLTLTMLKNLIIFPPPELFSEQQQEERKDD
jgi:hypothetical protein